MTDENIIDINTLDIDIQQDINTLDIDIQQDINSDMFPNTICNVNNEETILVQIDNQISENVSTENILQGL